MRTVWPPFRSSLINYWETLAKPAGGEDEDGMVTLEVAFKDPRHIAKREELRRIFEGEIVPVIKETQTAIKTKLPQKA